MYILNTTFVITRNIEPDFVSWLKDVYLKAALSTGIFKMSRVARVLTDQDPRALSLACELTAESISEAKRWHDETASLLRDDMTSRWGENAMFFTTYLKEI